MKSPDKDFYTLDYEYWKAGKDRVRRSFNPDFFIRIVISDYLMHLNSNGHSKAVDQLRYMQDQLIEDLMLAVEIKSDDDDSESTRAKGQYGEDHFKALNHRLKETNPIDLPESFRDSINQQYLFYVLRPQDYPGWFSRLRNGLIAMDY